ncbi:outer membrane protein assembly factor BamB [Hydrogenophaga sp. 5NK40-0174]|uniref:outer membrane protein assembly factor BamB n=1 Tax=Hydrogenophaga sp. 5NK40-0174 TaxID=3127649 RepID=UPI0033427D7D
MIPTLSASRAALAVLSCLVMAACSPSAKRPEPAPLAAVSPLMGVKLAWKGNVGASGSSVAPTVEHGLLLVAGADDALLALDSGSGKSMWRVDLGAPASSPAGYDGRTAAIITAENDLVVVEEGKEAWRKRLPARSFTRPVVAGGRVFVHQADRSVAAFDAGNGARLWALSRPGEPLVLQQPGVMLAVGNTLVVGLSGYLAGIDPDAGRIRWTATVANPRGTNEVERLVDLVAPYARLGESVCVRSFSSRVGCVDAVAGRTIWSNADQGAAGVSGDAEMVIGSDADGVVRAWNRATGAELWSNARLKYRQLTAPRLLGQSVAIGDADGWVHLVSRKDGSELNRLSTDGSPVVGSPVLAGDVLVVQTQKGGLFAWRPE